MAEPGKPEEVSGANKAEMPPPLSVKKRLLNLRTLIVFALAIALIVFILFRLDIDLSTTWETIKGSNFLLYVLAFAVYYATFPLRGWRWRILLRNAGFAREQLPSLVRFSQIMLINWFTNCILYARLGDAYRAYLLREESNASFSKTIGTVAAERVIDVVSVVILLLIAGLGFVHGELVGTARLVLWLGFGVAAVIVIVLGAWWLLHRGLEQRLPAKLRPIYTLFKEGIFGSFRQLPLLAILSIVIWFMEAGRLFAVSQALGFSLGLEIILFVALAHALITAIPVTPGGLGLAEAGVAGLLMLVVSREDAWSITILDRSISYLSLVVFGALLFLYLQIKRSRQKARELKSISPG